MHFLNFCGKLPTCIHFKNVILVYIVQPQEASLVLPANKLQET